MGDLKSKGFAGFFQRFKNTYFPAISETDTSMQSNYEGYLVPHKPCSTCCNWNKWKKLNCNLYCCHDQYDSKESYLTINRPMYREDIFYQGSLYPLSQYSRRGSQISGATQRVLPQNLPSLAYTLSVSRLATRSDMAQQNRCLWCPDAVLRTLATLLNYEMLKSPAFLILMVSGSLTLMGIYGCLIYAQGRGVEIGIEQGTAAMLLSVIGIANTVGRIACGVVSCFPVLDINLITWTTLIVGGGGTIVSIYFTTSLGQILYCSVFGVTIASFVVFRTIMFVEFFGLENLTNCFGLHMIFQGIAAFAALPVINAIYSSFNTFNAAFVFSGISILLSGLILIPLRRIIKWEHKDEVPS
ncbi:monocarboxylate transporter 3-like isoform X2 [Sitophilus oryzae]|uniref:Monocarboxylate transporter 3-like isoform X2 n=1 Tax=Sitophilus oryzae TaxID=7048 RepID=A0A6J2XU04_SITOR|nr:monocarboxylate transporter 3-like isoform X2 [Sitophilus oryzae]